MKASDLKAKLAASLERAGSGKRPSRTPRPSGPGTKCRKLSVSLFDRDLERVGEIQGFVISRRRPSPSTSSVIRAALRTVPLSNELIEALDETAAEDGRKVVKSIK